MKERHTALLEYIAEHGKTEVSLLADILGTSQVTIRKDLEYLSEKGMLKRERGYALPNDAGDIHYRIAFHIAQKQKIARRASDCIQDGEMLMIESGSTCALFAEQLAKTKKNVTIITNSVFLADYVKGYPNIELILLGGTLQPHSQSLVGLLTKNSAASFHVDKLFAGTDGYSRDFGFTGDDLARSDTLSAMTECADHVYILTDSGKFSHPGAVSFLPLQDVYEVITDEGLPKEEQDFLLSQGIRVSIA